MISNLKVLELASVLAGPNVGQFFAELGAEVIKIESLPGGGDVTRTWRLPGEESDDRSSYFCCTNWGKKSVAVDLLRDEGRRIIWDLVGQSDVVIVSYKAGDAQKLGVDYETLARINPRIIYGQITGYPEGDDRVGYDAVIQAESGFMYMNGEAGGNSLKLPVALMDILAGHQLKESLLVALLDRVNTRVGKLVSVSIFESAVASLANQATNWLVAGRAPKKHGTLHPNIAPYGEVFRTKDEKEILLAVGSDKQFRNLCEVVGLNDLINDEDFLTNELRVRNRVELGKRLKIRFLELDSATLMTELRKTKVPAGIISSVEEVLESPSTQQMLLEQGSIRGLRSFVQNEMEPLTVPPHFGEHTQSVLRDTLNYPVELIEKLRTQNIIK